MRWPQGPCSVGAYLLFSDCIPTPAYRLPGAPSSTNRVEMLSPGHQSKRRKLKGIPSFKEVWVPGAVLDLTFGDVVGGKKSPFLNGITRSNTQKILTHCSSPPPFFPIDYLEVLKFSFYFKAIACLLLLSSSLQNVQILL